MFKLTVLINLRERSDRRIQWCKDWIHLSHVRICRAIKDYRGFIGCIHSHLKVLHNVLEKGFAPEDWVCVMEDDAAPLVPGQTLPQLPSGIDILLLGCNPVHLVGRPPIKKVYQALCMTAALIRVRYIPRLIAIYEEALRRQIPLDMVTQEYQKRDRWWAMDPPLVAQRPSYSDIEQRFVNYSQWDGGSFNQKHIIR